MENINQNISKNLKSIRREMSLTLEDLADLSGVSKSMLGEIERGGANPTVLVLWKIADGLKIPFSKLISDEPVDYTLIRNDQQKLVNQEDGFTLFSLFPYREQYKTEIYRIELPPFGKLSNSGHRKGVDETIIVIEGTTILLLNDERIILNQGDAIRFKGELSHQVINEDSHTVQLIDILNYL